MRPEAMHGYMARANKKIQPKMCNDAFHALSKSMHGEAKGMKGNDIIASLAVRVPAWSGGMWDAVCRSGLDCHEITDQRLHRIPAGRALQLPGMPHYILRDDAPIALLVPRGPGLPVRNRDRTPS